MDVNVSTHALARWRERGACYADAPASDLVAALLTARRLPGDEPLPNHINRLDGRHYYHHAGSDTYLVVAHDNRDAATVVTVLPHRPPLPIPTPPTPVKRRAAAGQAEPPQVRPEPVFASILDEYLWCIAQEKAVDAILGALAGNLTRKDLCERKKSLYHRRAALKGDVMALRRQTPPPPAEQLFRRADGSIDLRTAYGYLDRQVRGQQRKIEMLQQQLARQSPQEPGPDSVGTAADHVV